MSVSKEREAVKALYPKARGWARRVDAMPDSQVIAILKKSQNKEKNK